MTYAIFRLSAAVEKMGGIKSNGNVFSIEGKKSGFISHLGEITRADGKMLGIVSSVGLLNSDYFDSSLYKVGRNGYIYRSGSAIGAVQQIESGIQTKWAQWAACCLFMIQNDDLTAAAAKNIPVNNKNQWVDVVNQKEIETVRSLATQNKESTNLRDETFYNSLELDAVNFYLERRKVAFQERKKRKK